LRIAGAASYDTALCRALRKSTTAACAATRILMPELLLLLLLLLPLLLLLGKPTSVAEAAVELPLS
jgi:hypothetical protein